MGHHASRAALLGAVLLVCAVPARAITITYSNPGPADSRVFVGFANDASGHLTADLVAQPAAASRNDTVFGPLPPIGQLPAFDAMAYGAAELGTNLNAPLGAGVRSVFAPLNLTFFQAHGATLAPSGAYASHAYAFSGNASASTPAAWVVHVDPSGVELPGTPVDVTVDASISGAVSVAGTSLAAAAWTVTTSAGGVIAGSASQSIPGTTPFGDAGTLTFTMPLGGTFTLLVDYDLTTSGSGAGADSTSEIAASLVEISAALTPPPMFTAVSGYKLLLIDTYAAKGKAKAVLLLKDSTPGAIAKGAAADPPQLSGTIELYQLADPSNRAVYALGAAGWSANTARVAKYADATAAPGGAGAARALVKPDKLVKLLARNLGDGDAASGDQDASDLDLTALAPADSIMAVVTLDNAADLSTHRLCAQFDALAIKPVAGGTGVKVLSKTSSLPATCP